MDELHAEGVFEGAGEDDVDELDGGGREALSEEVGFEGVDVGGAEPCELDVAGWRPGRCEKLIGALPSHGGLPPVGTMISSISGGASRGGSFSRRQVDAFVRGWRGGGKFALGAAVVPRPVRNLRRRLPRASRPRLMVSSHDLGERWRMEPFMLVYRLTASHRILCRRERPRL